MTVKRYRKFRRRNPHLRLPHHRELSLDARRTLRTLSPEDLFVRRASRLLSGFESFHYQNNNP